MPEELGKELRKLRREMRMTQEELAEELGIDPVQISKYESGKIEIKGRQLMKLMKLHDERTRAQDDRLLRQIGKLSAGDRMMVEQLIARLAGETAR